MDPFTIVGAVSAIASLVDLGARLCLTLNGMASTSSSAPAAMSLMSSDVSALCSLLQRLQTTLEDGDSHGLQVSLEAKIDLHDVLKNCAEALSHLERVLSKFAHYTDLRGSS